MKLERPLCVFDVEATGTDPATDRIVSLGVVLITPAMEVPYSIYHRIFNPGVKMTDQVIAVHGITNEFVSDKAPFSEAAPVVHAMLSDCDLAGFNLSNFDIPILWEEFNRLSPPINWNLDGVRVIDCGNIFKKKEPRTLAAAVKFFCGQEQAKTHEALAHDALADAEATAEVLFGQLKRYPDLDALTLDELAAFSRLEENSRIDLAGKLVRDKDGDAVYNFGRNKGTKIRDDCGLAYWMLGKDFSQNTKNALIRELHKLEAEAKAARTEEELDADLFSNR